MKSVFSSIHLIACLCLAGVSSARAQRIGIDMYGATTFNRVGSLVTVSVERITNYRPLGTWSGTLALQLWATELPYNGYSVPGVQLCEIQPAPLWGGDTLYNVVRTSTFLEPSPGNYNIACLLVEWTGYEYAMVDWVNFSGRFYFGYPPQIMSATVASATVGIPFSYQIVAVNSPLLFGATGLPPGLYIDTLTGTIFGTPTAAGTYQVVLAASNGRGTGTTILSLTVRPHIPVITSPGTASGQVGTPFSYQITADYGPTSFGAAGSQPQGVPVHDILGED